MKFKFNNYSLHIGSRRNYQWFKWRVFMDEPEEKLTKVKTVEYRLPETFPNPIRVIENQKSKFTLELSGGDNFLIYITIYLEDGTEECMDYYLDLRNNWPLDKLGGVNLEGENLEGANLERANLEGANLRGAKLVRAKLNKAILKNAELNGANLKRTELESSNLENAKLIGADLEDANLPGANLKNAKLNNANLHGIKLNSANLDGADFTEAKIRDADLRKVKFSENTDFRGVDINSITIDNLDGSNWPDAKWDPWVREDIEKKYR